MIQKSGPSAPSNGAAASSSNSKNATFAPTAAHPRATAGSAFRSALERAGHRFANGESARTMAAGDTPAGHSSPALRGVASRDADQRGREERESREADSLSNAFAATPPSFEAPILFTPPAHVVAESARGLFTPPVVDAGELVSRMGMMADGALRLELGRGALRGSSIVMRADGKRVALEVEGTGAVDELVERAKRRLGERGFTVE